MTLSDRPWHVAVVGGGVAGAVAAIHAARAGLKVVLLEKEGAAHDKVCGDFICSEGVKLIEEVGVDFAKLGASTIVEFGLNGPTQSASTELPISCKGLSRWVLDDELLRLASESGVDVRRGVFVRDLHQGPPLHLVTDEGPVFAERVILATGKTEFRALGARRGRDTSYVALETHVRLRPDMARSLRGKVELFVFKHGYAGLVPIEGGVANFCCLISQSALGQIGADWDSLATHIARHNRAASFYLEAAEPLQKRLTTIGRIPYGFVRAGRAPSGVFCVGDQMAVIASLIGDGVSVAAMTGKEAAAALVDRRSGVLAPARASHAFHRRMRRRLQPQVDFSFWLHRLFRRPVTCDGAAYLLRTVPGLSGYVFFKTRVLTTGHSRLVSLPRAMLISLGRSKGDGSHAGR